ncbi:MAG: PEP/pyruvate-binding domain-containing protein [Propionibacteriaceae bacterium]|nr:PEP/pyruvate-binding domain-containing protein [Propionibacteriaceae bacterium]
MDNYNAVSTGIPGLDRVIDGLRLGDNVVWQVDSVDDYRRVVEPYVERARADGREIIYVRFAMHAPVIADTAGVTVIELDPSQGFENFATAVHHLVVRKGTKAFYVFDCLSDLLSHWHSDLMVMNFFRVTCPSLYELDTVAYFAIIRNLHSFATVASIRHTTQVLFDLYLIDDRIYVHPLKVWERYSPTMYFPHRLAGDDAVSITSSGASARLFASLNRGTEQPDPWHVMLDRARDALFGMPDEQEAAKDLLLAMLIGRDGPMVELCRRHLNLADLLAIADREIGTGAVGGKSVGMLVARAVLENDPVGRFSDRFEPHDSFFLGADLFYTYLVANHWWRLWSEHKTKEGYFTAAAELREVISTGKFPTSIREQFMRMLEYFGQSPIIVRSSSLLEDNYGNAFAGKYDSVFCVNHGTPEERLRAFEEAVLTVYASAVSEDALAYRKNRNLVERDEQMAVLVQRVSGEYHGTVFFPHAAGVANSSNLYVWDPDTDQSAGMARLVFGLGTRAVDRVHQDYARIVALDHPTRKALVDPDDEARWSQHYVDVLHLIEGDHRTVPLADLLSTDIGASWSLFATPDYQMIRRLRDQGRRRAQQPMVLDFAGLLTSDFPRYLRSALRALEEAYAYPVDVEFTVNVADDDSWRINLVQCRPLQTRGLGKAVAVPEIGEGGDYLFTTQGNFMGGNVRLPLRYVIAVRPEPYLALGQQDRYAVAREIGLLNRLLEGEDFMLMGPGRWGTTTPSLGVPVRFTEVANASVLCEFTYAEGNFLPELSYGSHFFQDLVETGIFYVALFEGSLGTQLNEQRLLALPNLLAELDPGGADLAGVVHVVRFDHLELYSDVVSQRLVCR